MSKKTPLGESIEFGKSLEWNSLTSQTHTGKLPVGEFNPIIIPTSGNETTGNTGQGNQNNNE